MHLSYLPTCLSVDNECLAFCLTASASGLLMSLCLMFAFFSVCVGYETTLISYLTKRNGRTIALLYLLL